MILGLDPVTLLIGIIILIIVWSLRGVIALVALAIVGAFAAVFAGIIAGIVYIGCWIGDKLRGR